MNKKCKDGYAKCKKIISVFIALACIIALAGCSDNIPSNPPEAGTSADMSAPSALSTQSDTRGEEATSVPDNKESSASLTGSSAFAKTAQNNSSAVITDPPVSASSAQTGGETMPTVNIKVGSASFTVILYDNTSTRTLLERMPLSLNMDELNGNEKYYFLTDSLPNDSGQVGSISTGDLMLYGSDCLVLFYKSFSTSHSYTRLGYIKDTSGLADALGCGNVQVTFSVD